MFTAVFTYPTVANIYNKMVLNRIIKQHNDDVETISTEDMNSLKNEITEYNSHLRGCAVQKTIPEHYYDFFLSEIIGYVEIPSISQKLPIFQGTEEDVLSKGIGHIPSSTLPNGDFGNIVLTGHTGLSSALLFTRLDEVKKGDNFYLTVLGETYCYKVTDIRIVLPYEVDSVQINQDRKLCTLVTCTPYGVNSHRLLVTGEQTEMEAEVYEQEKVSDTETILKSENFWRLYVAAGFLLFLVISTVIQKRTNSRTYAVGTAEGDSLCSEGSLE